MNFVFDENTSPRLVDFMKLMGASNVYHLTEFFPKGTKDPVFLPWLAEQGYVLVTCDKAMRKAHKDVMQNHNIKALFLPKAYADQWGVWEQAEFMFRYWRKVAGGVERLRHLSLKIVTVNGSLNDF